MSRIRMSLDIYRRRVNISDKQLNYFVKIDADIVHFNEVEDCRVLRLLMDMLPGHGYRAYLVPGTDNMTGQNVGVLTRIDPPATYRQRLKESISCSWINLRVSASYIFIQTAKTKWYYGLVQTLFDIFSSW